MLLLVPCAAGARTAWKTVDGQLFFGREISDAGTLTQPVPRTFRFRKRPEETAIRALLAGPTLSERRKGYFSEVTGLRLLRLTYRGRRRVAVVDYGAPRSWALSGTLSGPRLREQTLRTLAQFGRVKQAIIQINGRRDFDDMR
jgi:spore germination protein GerM